MLPCWVYHVWLHVVAPRLVVQLSAIHMPPCADESDKVICQHARVMNVDASVYKSELARHGGDVKSSVCWAALCHVVLHFTMPVLVQGHTQAV